MIIRGNGGSSVDSLDPAEIVAMKCRERRDKSGDVMISTSFTVRTKKQPRTAKMVVLWCAEC